MYTDNSYSRGNKMDHIYLQYGFEIGVEGVNKVVRVLAGHFLRRLIKGSRQHLLQATGQRCPEVLA
jgi:hypothetical protein